MRNGTTLLLDEIDAGSANTLLCLQPILEGKPYYFKLKNEMIVPAAGFNILATANTKGKGSDDGRYIGTNVLNEAFLERFAVTFEQEYPAAKVEVKIIKNLMQTHSCVDDEFAETLVKWAEAIRRTFEDGGVDETITTRRMIHIVRAFAIFKNREKAVQLCCNRFDASTKTAFIDLFEKVSNPAPEVEQQPTPAPTSLDEEIPF
jgi:MoxR-like ATPase